MNLYRDNFYYLAYTSMYQVEITGIGVETLLYIYFETAMN